jgi:cbb3-type cytochrome oxidase subunit 3
MGAMLTSAWTTVALFAAFVAISLWAWSSARRGDFDADARLPIQDDDVASRRVGCGECGKDCS